MKLLVNLSWKCDLRCPYCLLPHIKINRDAEEHHWAEWALAFTRQVPKGSSMDFAGGEPLQFLGFEKLVAFLGDNGFRWAMTTNAMSRKGIERLIEARPKGCVLVNVSDHPGNQRLDEHIDLLKRHFPVVMNRVDHPDAPRKRKGISSIIPYQSWREGTELDGIRRHCNSGLKHWVLDPAGDVFRCNPEMAQGKTPIGNIFRGTVVKPSAIICETGCSTCYTSVPGAWPVDMKPV